MAEKTLKNSSLIPSSSDTHNYRLQRSSRQCFTRICDSVHGGGGGSGRYPRGRHPPGQTPPRDRHPPPADGHCSGWYASYWNAFLLLQAKISQNWCIASSFWRGRGVTPTDTRPKKWTEMLLNILFIKATTIQTMGNKHSNIFRKRNYFSKRLVKRGK